MFFPTFWYKLTHFYNTKKNIHFYWQEISLKDRKTTEAPAILIIQLVLVSIREIISFPIYISHFESISRKTPSTGKLRPTEKHFAGQTLSYALCLASKSSSLLNNHNQTCNYKCHSGHLSPLTQIEMYVHANDGEPWFPCLCTWIFLTFLTNLFHSLLFQIYCNIYNQKIKITHRDISCR